MLAERPVDAEVAAEVGLLGGGEDQVVPPEVAGPPTRRLLDRDPGVTLELELLVVAATHMDVVVDQLVIRQRRPGRVQANR